MITRLLAALIIGSWAFTHELAVQAAAQPAPVLTRGINVGDYLAYPQPDRS
jgi:hypothetical protein